MPLYNIKSGTPHILTHLCCFYASKVAILSTRGIIFFSFYARLLLSINSTQLKFLLLLRLLFLLHLLLLHHATMGSITVGMVQLTKRREESMLQPKTTLKSQ